MKKSVKLFYLPVLLFLIVTQTRAQDLHKIENDYSIIQAKLKLENVKLDSLKNALDKRAAKIDDEKKKDKPDKDLIVSLMSGSANLSNEIEGQQNKIENTRKSILELSKNLSKIYSEKIDSLQELEKSNEFKGNKNDLGADILMYTEKKLMVAPKISLLSFHPDKIIEIDLRKIKDSSERNMYEDYLRSALSEVNMRLDNLNQSITETSKILNLQKKTNKFLEESEFDYVVTPQSNISQPKGANANSFTGPVSTDASNVRAAYEKNLNEYSLLLNQLNFKPLDPKLKWDITLDGKKPIQNLSDYNELQKEVKKRLLEYKLILTHKLNADK